MNPGAYDTPIAIYEQTTTTDEYGEQTPQLTLIWKCRAQISPVRGYAMIAAGSDWTKTVIKINLRTPKVPIPQNAIIRTPQGEYEMSYSTALPRQQLTEIHATQTSPAGIPAAWNEPVA